MKYKTEWFNDDEFWQHYAPVMFDDKRWAEVPAAADGITRLAGLDLYNEKSPRRKSGAAVPKNRKSGSQSESEGPQIIDLCCGFGRITLELARRGFTASGVDITASYLDTARDDAAYEGLQIEFIQDDVRKFKRKETYDVAVNLYNSFGYFENPKDDLLFLKNAFFSLRENGALIIDVLGKEIAVRDYTEAEWFERAGYTVLTECFPVDSWASTWNRWILLKDGKRREKTFVQRLYAASELRSLLLKAGFSAVELYGSWDESPYDNDAQTLIAVARKK